MKINERFVGNNLLFQGDRSLLLRRIPLNAKITKAQASITPIDRSGRIGPSEDYVVFEALSPTGTNGETIIRVMGSSVIPITPSWIEIDFHRKVTLLRMIGTDLGGATLQVDIGGGTFIEVNANGAFKTPGDDSFILPVGSVSFLPSLTVQKIRLTKANGTAIDVTQVLVRNTASNVTLRIAESAPFFVQPGDLVNEQSSIDFSQMLEASLATAKQESGFYLVSLNLSTSTLARVELNLEIDTVNQQSALPDKLASVKLPYTFNAVSESANKSLDLAIPVGARLVSADTRVKIEGSFTNSTVVQGSLDQVDESAIPIVINTALTQAQAFSLMDNTENPDIAIDAFDLLLTSVSPVAKLHLDLRADLDGKPDSVSLLSKAIELSINTDTFPSPTWANVVLSQPIKLAKVRAESAKPARYWLILQSIEGEAQWSLADSADDPLALLQQSTDGGLSWRENVQIEIANQAYAEFRLRQKTATFKIPLEVKVGEGEQATRLKLNKFEPLGRVDFELDSQDLTETVNHYLNAVEQQRCPEGEQLLNSDFQLELQMPTFTLLGWQQIGPGLAPSGSPLDAIIINSDIETGGISQTAAAVAGCHYELSAEVNVEGEDARIDMIWRGDSCNLIKTEELTLPNGIYQSDDRKTPVYRLRTQAPEGVEQVEIRLVVPNSSSVLVDRISLIATPQPLLNADLMERQDDELMGWRLTPKDAQPRKMFVANMSNGQRFLSNISEFLQPVFLAQKAEVQAGKNFDFEFIGSATLDDASATMPPEIHLSFLTDTGETIFKHNPLIITPDSAETHVLRGTIPDTASQAEIQILLPQSTTLTVKNTSLVTQTLQEVPITFLSQAPGDLTVTDLTIGFEEQPAPPPPLPALGFCDATPASQLPDDECCDQNSSCFCNKCQQKTTLVQTTAVLLPDNRPATIGLCHECRLPLLTNTGRLVYEATSIPIRRIDRSNITQADTNIALTDIAYIGEVRALILHENGLTRVNQLATARVEYLVEILDVNEDLAESFVIQAKKLLIETQLKTASVLVHSRTT
jgi:hypothetical protein